MVHDRLTKIVLHRLGELGLPSSLIELGEFRDNFFFHRWVMFVRDGDDVANVHLVQPREDARASSRNRAQTRQPRRSK